MSVPLSKSTTLQEFENGYWYANDLKAFVKELGVANYSKLRKDQLEKIITHFLKTGKIQKAKTAIKQSREKSDLDLGLRTDLPIINYIGNKITKQFIVDQAKLIDPELKEKSGVRYRLNRWREEQLAKGKSITYGDLIQQYLELNYQDEKFSKIPTGRYINFLSDFMSSEKGASREEAIKAWKKLKALDVPKTYEAWKSYKGKK